MPVVTFTQDDLNLSMWSEQLNTVRAIMTDLSILPSQAAADALENLAAATRTNDAPRRDTRQRITEVQAAPLRKKLGPAFDAYFKIGPSYTPSYTYAVDYAF